MHSELFTSRVRRAEWVLVVLMLLALVLPQLLGAEEAAPAENQRDIAGLADLEKATFVTVTGSTYANMVPRIFPEAKLMYVSDWPDEGMAVTQFKADALVRENSSLPALREEYPDLMALPEAMGELDVRWATRKTAEGKAIRDAVNAFAASLEPGFLDEMYRKWENPDTAPDHVETFEMTGEPKGELTIVSCLDWPPMSYLNGENACGYMIELINRFCAWAGYTPVMEYVSVTAALAGFSAGKYDLFGYGIEYREEAEDSMYFTEPLFVEPVYAIIHRNRYIPPEGASVEEQQEPVTQETGSRWEAMWKRLQRSIDLNFIREDRWKQVLGGLGVTVALSLLSTLLGTALGGVICAMRMSRHPYPNAFARIYIRLLQGTPIVMLLLVLYYIVFRSVRVDAFWVCVLGFSLDFSAYSSEIFRGGIEAIPEGQLKAAKALGFTPVQAFHRVTLPQMVTNCLPVYIGQMIATVKLTSVAGYISVQDLTRVSDIIRSRTYEAFFPLIFTAVVYFLIAAALIVALRSMEQRTDPARRKRKVKGVTEHAAEG